MCDYVNKNELKVPKEVFQKMINSVQDYIRKQYKITFSYRPIGSGSRNMVIRKCNQNFFDLDYQIEIKTKPDNMNWNDCKEFKDIFRKAFDKYKPNNFTNFEDSTQALTAKNNKAKYGFDIIITTYDEDGNFYILYNKKDTNNANNMDYMWAKRKNMNKFHERLALVNGAEMWNYLRNIYMKKRHNHKDDVEPNKKKSYQILNESVVETLNHFYVIYPR